MTELEFCGYWCGELTEQQKAVLAALIKKNMFYGVARGLCHMHYSPAIKGIHGKWDIIDKLGYRQLSAIDGRKMYDPSDSERLSAQ